MLHPNILYLAVSLFLVSIDYYTKVPLFPSPLPLSISKKQKSCNLRQTKGEEIENLGKSEES